MVDFQLDEMQAMLKELAHEFAQDEIRPNAEHWDETAHYPKETIQTAHEMGLLNLHIPEAYGGLGLGHVELIALMEIMGEHLACAPFLSSTVLSTNLILEAGHEAQKEALLPALAEGDSRASLAFVNRQGGAGPEDITATVERAGNEYRIHAEYGFVVDGHSADHLIVAARTPGSEGLEGISLFVIPGDLEGVARRALPTMDQTRRLAEVDLPDVVVPAEALLGDLSN